MLSIYNQTSRNSSKKAGLGAAEESRDQFQTGPSYLRLFFLGQTGWIPLCHRCTKSPRTPLLSRVDQNQLHLEGPQWSICTLVLCLMQKTQDLGLAVTRLQPKASVTSQIPWSAPAIICYGRCWHDEKSNCTSNRAARSPMLQHCFTNRKAILQKTSQPSCIAGD